jgi:hypothetical protein
MARAARIRAQESFSIDAHGRRLQACYDRLLASGAGVTALENHLA